MLFWREVLKPLIRRWRLARLEKKNQKLMRKKARIRARQLKINKKMTELTPRPGLDYVIEPKGIESGGSLNEGERK